MNVEFCLSQNWYFVRILPARLVAIVVTYKRQQTQHSRARSEVFESAAKFTQRYRRQLPKPHFPGLMMPYCLVLAWRPELRPAEKLKYLKYYYSSLNKYSTIVSNEDIVFVLVEWNNAVFIPIHSLTAVARFYKMRPFSLIQMYISLVNHLQKYIESACFCMGEKGLIVILEGDSW